MKLTSSIVLFSLLSIQLFGQSQKIEFTPKLELKEKNESFDNTISRLIQAISQIKAGQEREELNELFTGSGGISTTIQQTYVLKECGMIKVDVEFEVSDRITPLASDKITKISKPYLAFLIID